MSLGDLVCVTLVVGAALPLVSFWTVWMVRFAWLSAELHFFRGLVPEDLQHLQDRKQEHDCHEDRVQ